MGYAGSNYEQGIAPESGSLAGNGSLVGLNADGEFILTEAPGGGGGGDITSVAAGDGLTGGGTTGAVTLTVGAGTGIDVATNAISVDVSDFLANGADNRIVTAVDADSMNAEANLKFGGANLEVTGAVHISGSGANKLVIQKGVGDSTKEIVFTENGVENGGIYFNNSDHFFIRNENNGKDIILRVENASGDGRNIVRVLGTQERLVVGAANNKTAANAVLDVDGSATVSGTFTVTGEATFEDDTDFFDDVKIVDNKNLLFGTDNDAAIQYDETTQNRLIISGSTTGIALAGGSIALDYGTVPSKTISSGTAAGAGSFLALDASNVLVVATPAGGGGADPAGSDGQVQFNEGGSDLGASANLTWDDTNLNAKALVVGSTAATLSGHAGEFTTLSSMNSSSAKYTTQYDAVGKFQGDILSLGNSPTVQNKLYYLSEAGHFGIAQANDDDTGANQLLGIALNTNSTTHGMLRKGTIRITGSLVDDTMTIGAPVYMASGTAGHYQFATPAKSEDIVRQIGYCLDTNLGAGGQQSDMLLLFDPSDTYIEIA